MNGSYDFIINNYYDINISDEILKDFNKDINTLINNINRYRIYTINKIPRLNEYNDKINFMNTKLIYSMDNFSDDEGNNIYEKKNLLIYLSNFLTHIRIVKEKMDLDPDTIILKYKRVNNYENIDTIQSIINVLHDPNTDVPEEDFIELISQNTGISIDDAALEYKKWTEKQEKNDFKKKSLKTTETGAEIIMTKYLDSNIKFAISILFSPNASKESKYEAFDNLHIVFLTLNFDLAIWHEVILHSSLFVTANKIVSSSAPAFFNVLG